jgi:hypothetical protein
MFEALTAGAARAAQRRAQERAQRLAAEMGAAMPSDIEVAADERGVRLSGRALRRRLALDPALKWTLRGLVR